MHTTCVPSATLKEPPPPKKHLTLFLNRPSFLLDFGFVFCFETESQCVDQAGPKLTALRPQVLRLEAYLILVCFLIDQNINNQGEISWCVVGCGM